MLCVIAALLLPVLQMKYQLVRTGLVTENRKKAPMPNNAWTILSTHSTYASDFEKYFNDNFGFRDLLIRLKNQFEYSLFAFSSQVHIGPNKWLFYKGTYEDTVLALERLRPDMNKLFSRMRRLRDLLAAKGITLVVVPCPMKTTMYQEELPPIDIHVPEFSSFDEYRQFLREEPGIITIDAEKILRDLKEKMQVYHRTDFHWNDPAGAHTLVELLATMERKAGVPISQKPSIAVRIDPHTGGGGDQFPCRGVATIRRHAHAGIPSLSSSGDFRRRRKSQHVDLHRALPTRCKPFTTHRIIRRFVCRRVSTGRLYGQIQRTT